MKYLSVCSGIEAASVAWQALGWHAVGLSDIDPFARAVLATRMPTVPLHGDFAELVKNPPACDVLVGGTPCQAFSVAGHRRSLDDARYIGNAEGGALDFAVLTASNAAKGVNNQTPLVFHPRQDPITSLGFSHALGNCAPAVVFDAAQVTRPRSSPGEASDVAPALHADGCRPFAFAAGNVVRRFTPRECERLQGFPDDWTTGLRGRKASDTARYRAIGNSMAVPVVRWIGERIAQHVASAPPEVPVSSPSLHLSRRDVFDFMRCLKDESVDCVVTDPPYGTKERHRRIGTTTRLQTWFPTMNVDDLARFLEECYRVLKPDTYAFVMVDDDACKLLEHRLGVGDALLALQDKATSDAPRCAIGFRWWTPHIWVKTNGGELPAPEDLTDEQIRTGGGYHGRQCYEKILVLGKGKGKMATTLANVHPLPRQKQKPAGTNIEATTPKPPELAERLVRAVLPMGGLVVEPFAGSGGLAVGALRAGCSVIANDVDTALTEDWLANRWRLPYTTL